MTQQYTVQTYRCGFAYRLNDDGTIGERIDEESEEYKAFQERQYRMLENAMKEFTEITE